MMIRAVLFDLYSTLLDVKTDDDDPEVYRAVARFLRYRGVVVHGAELREAYAGAMRRQRAGRAELFPEIDVEAIWLEILQARGASEELAREPLGALARALSELHRALSRRRLRLYPDVLPTLEALGARFALGMVSDAQPCFALAELREFGLDRYFPAPIVSAPRPFRKPDPRLFREALDALRVAPHEAIFVGNDMFRDIHGSSALGMRTIFFASGAGEQSFPGASPDYVASSFRAVLDGVAYIERAPLGRIQK